MTPEQATALVVALSGLVGAIGTVVFQIRALRKDLNGRVSQLIEVASSASKRQGELEGRDFMHRLLVPPSGSPGDVQRIPPSQEQHTSE